MPTRWDRLALTGAALGVWVPGLFLLRYVAHLVSGRNGSGASALIGFAVSLLLCLILLRLVWWLPYRSTRSWTWASAFALALCGIGVWVGTALANSVAVELGDDLLWSALLGLGSGAPLALAYGALGGFLIGLCARAGGAQEGPSQRPLALATACSALLLAGTLGVGFFVFHDPWLGAS